MNEAETRAEHINPALTAAGRGVAERGRTGREYANIGRERRPHVGNRTAGLED